MRMKKEWKGKGIHTIIRNVYNANKTVSNGTSTNKLIPEKQNEIIISMQCSCNPLYLNINNFLENIHIVLYFPFVSQEIKKKRSLKSFLIRRNAWREQSDKRKQ